VLAYPRSSALHLKLTGWTRKTSTPFAEAREADEPAWPHGETSACSSESCSAGTHSVLPPTTPFDHAASSPSLGASSPFPRGTNSLTPNLRVSWSELSLCLVSTESINSPRMATPPYGLRMHLDSTSHLAGACNTRHRSGALLGCPELKIRESYKRPVKPTAQPPTTLFPPSPSSHFPIVRQPRT
jgi:hypothetical protein